MSEPSEELPLRRVSTDTVIESRWAEADGFPMPLAGLKIREMGSQLVSGAIIASKFGVTYRTIRNIISGKKWKHLLPGGRTAN